MRLERDYAISKPRLEKKELSPTEIEHLQQTWSSIQRLTSPSTGLACDRIREDQKYSYYTSPSNIGAQLWSAVIANQESLGNNPKQTAEKTLDTLSELETHHGLFLQWNDTETGRPLSRFSLQQEKVEKFVSSIDNAWLAIGLMTVREAIPELAQKADSILREMDFEKFYDKRSQLIRGGFYPEKTSEYNQLVWRYQVINSETRIIYYVAIAKGDIPPEAYYAPYRTPPPKLVQKREPQGTWRETNGRKTFHGHYFDTASRYKFIPSYNGTAFEPLMPALFVPEHKWSPNSWGLNHQRHIEGQKQYGMNVGKGKRLWGISPCDSPYGYIEARIPEMGINPNRYRFHHSKVITPHAIYLALPHQPEETLSALDQLEKEFPEIRNGHGYWDSITFPQQEITKTQLSLNQGMIMAALGHQHLYQILEEPLKRVKPLIQSENFGIK